MSEAQPKFENHATPVGRWQFENFRDHTDHEKPSWIEYSDTTFGNRIDVFVDSEKSLTVDTDRDQWGVFVAIKIGDHGVYIAQEDGTESFLDAMISALTRLRGNVEVDTLPSTYTEATQ